jgi:hypothetical protein
MVLVIVDSASELDWRARPGKGLGEAVPAFVVVALSTSRVSQHTIYRRNRWQPEP